MEAPQTASRSSSYGAFSKFRDHDDSIARGTAPQGPSNHTDENRAPSLSGMRAGTPDSFFGLGDADAALSKPLSPTNILYRTMRFRSSTAGPSLSNTASHPATQDDRSRLPSFTKKGSEAVTIRRLDGPRSVSVSHPSLPAASGPRSVSMRADVQGIRRSDWGIDRLSDVRAHQNRSC